MTEENGAELAKREAEKANEKLKRVRRRLYWLSLLVIVYFKFDLGIRFRDFGDGRHGFGLPKGLAIDGLSEEKFYSILLHVLFVLLAYFIWLAIVFVTGMRGSDEYKKRRDYILEADELAERGISKEEISQMNEVGEPDSIFIDYGIKLRPLFATVRWINEMLLPIILPILLGIIALCYLKIAIWC